MNCPKCNDGELRVLEEMICTCNHPFIICDKCGTFFAVECGPPFDASKLPPEFSISEVADMHASFKAVNDDDNRRLVEAGLAHKQKSLSDLIHGLAIKQPTLEDFKVQLMTIAIALDHDDCMQLAEDPDRKTQTRKRLSPWIPAVLLFQIVGIISFCSIDDSKTLTIVLALYAALAVSFAIFMHTMREKAPVGKKKKTE